MANTLLDSSIIFISWASLKFISLLTQFFSFALNIYLHYLHFLGITQIHFVINTIFQFCSQYLPPLSSFL